MGPDAVCTMSGTVRTETPASWSARADPLAGMLMYEWPPE